MSIKLTIEAWNCDLPPATKLVLLRLCDLANEENTCWPTARAIGERCGMDAGGVFIQLGELEARGLLEVIHFSSRTNGVFGWRYIVTLPKDTI